MDTVHRLDSPFQEAKQISDTVLVGPGVTDMKGGLCILLEALKLFEKSENAKNLGWELIINPDEEIGSIASGPFIEERAKYHQLGLVFEPAMDEKGTLASERKGSGKFSILVQGRAAHSGRDFHLGRNAITLLAKMIVEIDALNANDKGITFNVGYIEGGGSVNVVPAFAQCQLDIRTVAANQEAWILEKLNGIIADANQNEGFKVKLQGKFTRKPKVMSEKNQALYDFVARLGKELGQTITWKPSGGCSDGNNLSAVGLPNIDSLGVCGGKIHSEEEFCRIDSLVPRAKLVTAILLRLSEGEI